MTISITIGSKAGVNVNAGAGNYLDAVPSAFNPGENNFGYFYQSITSATAYGLAETKEGTVFSGGAALLARGLLGYNIVTHVVTGRLDAIAFGDELNGLSGGFGQTSTKMSLGTTDISFTGLGLDAAKGDDVNGILYGMMTGDANAFLKLLARSAVAFTGGAGADSYVGGNKADVLHGMGGADMLKGGLGNDKLYGDAAADKLYGNNGNDMLVGGAGADVLSGGGGADTASYAGATKGVTASLIKASVNTGDAKGDSYSSIENLAGSSKADRLYGDAKANTLNGAAGNDKLDGGLGADLLTGGAGRDLFIFARPGDSTVTKFDTITDFDRKAGDHIDLHAIDANTHRAGVQDFDFIGGAEFSKTAGELRFERSAGGTDIFADRNGDGHADFAIHLAHSLALRESDFVL